MTVGDGVLKRYALAYIKKSGGNSNVKEFLQFCNTQNTTDWSKENFEDLYKRSIESQNLNNGQNIGSGRNEYNERSNRQPTGPQVTHVYVHNKGLDFWDYLLLQCCIDSLFGGRGHTTVINNYGNTTQSREDKKKDSEDSRKLLALGVVVAVVCVAFHGAMCYFYHSSRKKARESEKIDYLDNKLKTFRNIEFAISAISLTALIACVFYPVLPVWGLAILGVNSLVCFAGGFAFQMKHDKESKDIKEAKTAVEGCKVSTHMGTERTV
ncbi:hypothetical protein [Wolbachia endosymbiont of Atemnus politus]|uniref:hypothetical protein n=1 Tax=Wolbachia endosymbiont of Atemnus politus TaxID=2682840 RepID=UPI00157491FC|nr:hypothetical protein [Wolbachia endosymbiont of Atemnus politus]